MFTENTISYFRDRRDETVIKCIRLPVALSDDGKPFVQFAVEEHKSIPYEVLKSTVDGCIEHIGIRSGVHMYLNEDGKGLGLPNNEFATYLAQTFAVIAPWDNIVGNVILVGDEHPTRGTIMSLTAENISFLMGEFFNCFGRG